VASLIPATFSHIGNPSFYALPFDRATDNPSRFVVIAASRAGRVSLCARSHEEAAVPTADELLSAPEIVKLTRCLRRVAPDVTWRSLKTSVKGFDSLALSERVLVVRDALLADLPTSYSTTARIFRAALKDPSFRGWMVWPVGEAVAERAINSRKDRDFDDGLALLAQLTGRFTSEFAIRNFLNADLQRTLAAAAAWATSPDEAVRRLASEGTRPRLPWAKQVPAIRAHPAAAITILDVLYTDESETVRRSVANHLNDISRADPNLAVRTATRWLDNPNEMTPQLVRHAMRTLIKQAYPGALALMGFSAPKKISIEGPNVERVVVAIGEEIVFEGTILNEGPHDARLVIDYVVHFQKANGSTAPKVFKLTTRTLAPGESVVIKKRHSFKTISTRRHYAGPHSIELQVNGLRSAKADFHVVE
jgi:3-methyladenine DNA glycosylase AlkC